MTNLKVGIVEDELIIAENLSNILEEIGYEVTEVASTYIEALEMIETYKPDIILLDINLKGAKDGIEVAWKVKEQYNIPFIYLTANADAGTLARAKETEPAAYLIKPFNRDDLYTAIEICFYNYTKQKQERKLVDNYIVKDSIFIKEGHFFHKVKFNDILYLESDHVYVNIHTVNKKIMVRSSMQQYLTNFDENIFLRIHRSYVINIHHITTINTETIVIGNKELPLTKACRDELMGRIKIG